MPRSDLHPALPLLCQVAIEIPRVLWRVFLKRRAKGDEDQNTVQQSKEVSRVVLRLRGKHRCAIADEIPYHDS